MRSPPETIADAVAAVIAMARDARHLADCLHDHKRGADHRRHAALHALENSLRDFGMAVATSEAALSFAARAAIAAR
jgi:hypothetical protein